VDPLADDVVGQVKVEVFTGEVGDAFAAVHRGANLRMVFDEHSV
jgi:hypothetical protein